MSAVVICTSKRVGRDDSSQPVGYDPATRISVLREHTGFGSLLTANHVDFPDADGGMQLPGAPAGPFTTRTATDLTELNTYLNMSAQDITYTGGNAAGNISVTTGTHNKCNFSGATITGALDISGASSCHHLYFENGSIVEGITRAWNGDTEDYSNRAQDLHFKDMTLTCSDTLVVPLWSVHRCLLENCTIDNDAAGNPVLAEYSTNFIHMNCLVSAAKRADGHMEPTVRYHASHMCFVIDSALDWYLLSGAADTNFKANWRSHHGGASGEIGGGCNGLINVWMDRGGIQCGDPGYVPPSTTPHNSQLIFVDVTYGKPSSEETQGWGVPNSDPEFNTNAYALRCHYHNDEQTPDTAFTLAPPGTEVDLVYKSYASFPAWDGPYTSTPVTAAE